MIYFDSHDIRDEHYQDGKTFVLPLFFITKYGKKLIKRLNNIDERIDNTYLCNTYLQKEIPRLKSFNFTTTTYNNIQSYNYRFHKEYENSDEMFVEIIIEKHTIKDLWSIESNFELFLDSITDNTTKKITVNGVKKHNQKMMDCNLARFQTEIKKLQENVNSFFSQH